MEKTIAAVSTGMTASGISIVRMSGPEAIQIADTVYRSKKKKSLLNVKTHTIHYGYIHNNGKDLDEVLVSVMRAPHTFTGEDVVEINCHGGILITKQILALLFEKGACPAEPGEFTKRAFLNGKMDLSRAEAVADMISAKNDFAAKAAMKQLKGSVYESITALRNKILDEVAFIEAALDDPEHYDLAGYKDELSEHLQPVKEKLNQMISRAEYGSMLTEGIHTVIAGRPNAGKSSLLNILAGYEKAIVTEIAGTTRDILEENVRIGDISLKLMDTAGIRDTEDKVEQIGVNRAKEALKDADLVLYVVDRSEGITEEDREVLNSCEGKQVIILMNKTDLLIDGLDEEIQEYPDFHKIYFSAITGQGVNELEKMIISLFDRQQITYNEEVIITGVRHLNLLKEAGKSVDLVEEGIEIGASEEFLTVDMMNAYRALGEIIGEEVDEDVINRVFEKFCMGK